MPPPCKLATAASRFAPGFPSAQLFHTLAAPSAKSAKVDRRGASPQREGAAPPEGVNCRGKGGPGFLSDDEEDSDTEPDTSNDEDSPNPGVGAGDDPEGGNSEADDSEDWRDYAGDAPRGNDPEAGGADDETTHSGTCEDDWILLGFRPSEMDGRSIGGGEDGDDKAAF